MSGCPGAQLWVLKPATGQRSRMKRTRWISVVALVFGVLGLTAPAWSQTEPAEDAGERFDLFWNRQRVLANIAAGRHGHIVVSWSDVNPDPAWVAVSGIPGVQWLGKFEDGTSSLTFNGAIESVPGDTKVIKRCFTRAGKPMTGSIAAFVLYQLGSEEIPVDVKLDPKTGCGEIHPKDLRPPSVPVVNVDDNVG